MSSRNRLSRLFLDRDLAGDTLTLDDREARYLGTVLRLQPGDPVRLFNGKGQERNATIAVVARRHTELSLEASAPPCPESPLHLTLIQALPKADAMDLVVQKATELGVHTIVPVVTEFSVPRLDAERAAKRLERWNRIAESACEQSGRHTPTRISPVMSLTACLESLTSTGVRLILDTRARREFNPAGKPRVAEACLLIGPEGGFNPEDLDLVRAHRFQALKFGPRTLRTETAAIVACGVLQHLWGDAGSASSS